MNNATEIANSQTDPVAVGVNATEGKEMWCETPVNIDSLKQELYRRDWGDYGDGDDGEVGGSSKCGVWVCDKGNGSGILEYTIDECEAEDGEDQESDGNEEDNLDMEVEDSLESSITVDSSASSLSSLPSRGSDSLPLFLVSQATKTSVSESCVSPVTIPSESCLKAKTQAIESLVDNLSDVDRREQAKSRLSNLAQAFRIVKNSIIRSSHYVRVHSVYFSPRMTDDALPAFETHHKTADDAADRLTATRGCSFGHHGLKCREHRVNSLFLRLYAFDCDARDAQLFPSSYSTEELSNVVNKTRGARQFHRRYNLFKISELSRDKLWNSVVLPPRDDAVPRTHVDYASYMYVGDKPRLKQHVSLQCSRLAQCLAHPAGILCNGSSRHNGPSPGAGVSMPQYTKKGWCNPRWLDAS